MASTWLINDHMNIGDERILSPGSSFWMLELYFSVSVPATFDLYAVDSGGTRFKYDTIALQSLTLSKSQNWSTCCSTFILVARTPCTVTISYGIK